MSSEQENDAIAADLTQDLTELIVNALVASDLLSSARRSEAFAKIAAGNANESDWYAWAQDLVESGDG